MRPMSRIIGVDAATACVALARWSSEATDLAHVGDSGNSVWRFVDRGQQVVERGGGVHRVVLMATRAGRSGRA